MDDPSRYSGLEKHPAFSAALLQTLAAALDAGDQSQFFSIAAARIRSALGAETVALVRGEKGLWRPMIVAGATRAMPESILAEAVDRNGLYGRSADWLAIPVRMPAEDRTASAFLVASYKSTAADASQQLTRWSDWLGDIVAAVHHREQLSAKAKRLDAILQLVADWQGHRKLDELLQQMAEASTKLLASERATIFLRDRKSKQLIGRPALGVEGNEIRIPEHTGVVGQVVDTGEPRRVDVDVQSEQREIHRAVDQKLKFQTRSLLCVPLRNRKGEIIGAFEMINKKVGNFTDDDVVALTELADHAAGALESTEQFEHVVKSREQMVSQAAQGVQLIGNCPAIDALRKTIERVADTELSVLVLGENGTGKEVVSQSIHYQSRRRDEPLLAVNCAALAETLLESELFGHEKGAFTDARETRQGKFEVASGGTLFLDEIGDMSLGAQAKLLRVLEERVVTRVGGSKTISVDVRVLAATNRNLTEAVQAGRFREDLYYRLSVVTVDLPPLRKRGDDVLLLADHFLHYFCRKAQRKLIKFSAAAQKKLLAHSWPGNVRELRNLIERLAYLSAEDRIEPEGLAFILAPQQVSKARGMNLDLSLADATKQFQVDYIEQQIARMRGNMTIAAENMGLHRSNLYRKMRQLGMDGGEEEGVDPPDQENS